MSNVPLPAQIISALLLLAAGACLFKAGWPGLKLKPRRGKRRAPKNPPPAAATEPPPATPDVPEEPRSNLLCTTPNLSAAEAAQFEAFVHANPVLSSRLTQLWAGVEPDKEQAS